MNNLYFIKFKFIVFIFLIIPYLMHIYSYTISILYLNNIIYISVVIIVISLFIYYYKQYVPRIDKDILYFLPYIFSTLLLDIFY